MAGSDSDEVGNQYCCSIPFEKAIDPFGDCLIAYEMNGEVATFAPFLPTHTYSSPSLGCMASLYEQSFPVTREPATANFWSE